MDDFRKQNEMRWAEAKARVAEGEVPMPPPRWPTSRGKDNENASGDEIMVTKDDD